MAKSDLGTKRICPTTGKKFYDLNKSPVISPYTGELIGKMEIPTGTFIAPVVANGTMYLYTSDAQLVALR